MDKEGPVNFLNHLFSDWDSRSRSDLPLSVLSQCCCFLFHHFSCWIIEDSHRQLFSLMFAVADHFLQLGSIDVMKHTMSISPAKLVSEGPESLRPQPCSSQQSSDGALPTSSESNTSGDVDELADESEKAGGDACVHPETVLEELVKSEGEDTSAVPPSTVTEVVKPEGEDTSAVPPSTATEVVKPEGEDTSAVLPSTVTEVVKPEGEDTSAVPPSTATEVVKPEGEDTSAVLPSTATEVVKPEGEDVSVATVSNIVSDEQLCGAGDGSELLDIQDVAAPCSDAAVKDAQSDTQSETTVTSGDTAVDRDQSEGHELEKLHHDECRRPDNEPVSSCDTEQSDAAVQDTVDDAAVDGEPAARCSEVEHITDETSVDDQTLATNSMLPGQSAIVEQSLDIDMSAAVGSETNELAEEAVTVLVSDIPRGLDETVEMYLESKKKGGGKVLSFEYNERRGSALVVFADNAGNFNFCLISAHVVKSCL